MAKEFKFYTLKMLSTSFPLQIKNNIQITVYLGPELGAKQNKALI